MYEPGLASDIHVSTGHATDKTAPRPTPSPRQRTHPQPQQCHATTPHSSQSAARWICSGPRGVTVSTLDSESSHRGSNPREALLRFGNHAAHANASYLHLTRPRTRAPNTQTRAMNEANQDRKRRVNLDTLGIEPRAFPMRSGCDTTTPCAPT